MASESRISLDRPHPQPGTKARQPQGVELRSLQFCSLGLRNVAQLRRIEFPLTAHYRVQVTQPAILETWWSVDRTSVRGCDVVTPTPFSGDRGRCFRWVRRESTGQPTRCSAPVSTRGWWLDGVGRWWLVDACAEHAGPLVPSRPVGSIAAHPGTFQPGNRGRRQDGRRSVEPWPNDAHPRPEAA
jgi:hypothetical protein